MNLTHRTTVGVHEVYVRTIHVPLAGQSTLTLQRRHDVDAEQVTDD